MNYQNHYNKLIERSPKRKNKQEYRECHHIIPKCLGGNDEKSNLVWLTPEEHYLAHQLLIKIYPTNIKLVYAANMMTVGQHKRTNNKRYGWLRRKLSKISSERMKGKRPHNVGKPLAEDVKLRISQSTKGRKAWNKGQRNPTSAENGKKGAIKLSEKCKGRKRLYKADGSWTWIYP